MLIIFERERRTHENASTKYSNILLPLALLVFHLIFSVESECEVHKCFNACLKLLLPPRMPTYACSYNFHEAAENTRLIALLTRVTNTITSILSVDR